MTHFELKQLRLAIGASVAQFAALLGLEGSNAADTVRKMENGSKPISGPIAKLATYLQEGVLDTRMKSVMPKFLLCDGMDDDSPAEIIMHTEYPRFFAHVVGSDNLPENSMAVQVDDIGSEWLLVTLLIDEPIDSVEPLLWEAAALLENYTSSIDE